MREECGKVIQEETADGAYGHDSSVSQNLVLCAERNKYNKLIQVVVLSSDDDLKLR